MLKRLTALLALTLSASLLLGGAIRPSLTLTGEPSVLDGGLGPHRRGSLMRKLSRAVLLLAAGLSACGALDQFSPARRLAKAEEEMRAARDDYWRMWPLGQAAMASVDVGDYEKAKRYAEELLRLSHDL